MPIPTLPVNDGWTDVEYDLGDPSTNRRIGAILNDACHVFHHHSGGTWNAHDKDVYARRLAVELQQRPGLAGRLLSTEDRVVKMVTHRALEILRGDTQSNS